MDGVARLEAIILDKDGVVTGGSLSGDDVIDDDAFRALDGRGVGVLIAEALTASAAVHRLRGSDEVPEFLVGLASHLEAARE
jgi:3-deoxy-D-manno-octulosonate 8-phosphate phosphatase KdsC-like HAD superfamily phosphatase